MELIMGFEFEFGFRKEINQFDHQIFSIIKKDLQLIYGRIFTSKIREITNDGSLQFSRKEYEYTGVELITKPLPEEEAMTFLSTFIKWMKTNKKVITNKTCSIHVNISIKDKKINKKLDYFEIINYVPQELILKHFARQNNTYCLPTNKKLFSLEQGINQTPKHSIDFWLSKINNAKTHTTLRKSQVHLYKKNNNPPHKGYLIFKDKNEALQIIKDAYIKRLHQDQKGIAIVEKNYDKINKYYEFRLIGNANYHYQLTNIKKFIKIYQRSITVQAKRINFSLSKINS